MKVGETNVMLLRTRLIIHVIIVALMGGGGFLILEANYLIKLVITMIDAITTIMLPTKEKEVK